MELVILSCAFDDLRLQRRVEGKLLPGMQIIPIGGEFMWSCDDGRKGGRGSAAEVLAAVKAYLEDMS